MKKKSQLVLIDYSCPYCDHPLVGHDEVCYKTLSSVETELTCRHCNRNVSLSGTFETDHGIEVCYNPINFGMED